MDRGAGAAAAAATAAASSFVPIEGGDAPVAGEVDQFSLLNEQQLNGLIAAVRIRRLAGLDGGDTACGIWLSLAANNALYVEEPHCTGLYEVIGWESSEKLADDLSSIRLWLRQRPGRTTLDTIFRDRLGLDFRRDRDSKKYATHVVTELGASLKRRINWINLGAPATRTTSPESQFHAVSPVRVRVGHFRRLTMKITERDVRTNAWAQNYITTNAFKRATAGDGANAKKRASPVSMDESEAQRSRLELESFLLGVLGHLVNRNDRRELWLDKHGWVGTHRADSRFSSGEAWDAPSFVESSAALSAAPPRAVSLLTGPPAGHLKTHSLLRRSMLILQFLDRRTMGALTMVSTALTAPSTLVRNFAAFRSGFAATSGEANALALAQQVSFLTALLPLRGGEEGRDAEDDIMRVLTAARGGVGVALRARRMCACTVPLSSGVDSRKCRCPASAAAHTAATAPATPVAATTNLTVLTHAQLEAELKRLRAANKNLRRRTSYHTQRHTAKGMKGGLALPPIGECTVVELAVRKLLVEKGATLVRTPVLQRSSADEIRTLKQHLRRASLDAFLFMGSRRKYNYALRVLGFGGALGSVRSCQRMVKHVDFPIGKLHEDALRTMFLSITLALVQGNIFTAGKRPASEEVSPALLGRLHVRCAEAEVATAALSLRLAVAVLERERGAEDVLDESDEGEGTAGDGSDGGETTADERDEDDRDAAAAELSVTAHAAAVAHMAEAKQHLNRERSEPLVAREVTAAEVQATRQRELDALIEYARLYGISPELLSPAAGMEVDGVGHDLNELEVRVKLVQREMNSTEPEYALHIKNKRERHTLRADILKIVTEMRMVPSKKPWPSVVKLTQLLAEYTGFSVDDVRTLYDVFEVRDAVTVRNGTVISTKTDDVVGSIRNEDSPTVNGDSMIMGVFEDFVGAAEEFELTMVRAVHANITSFVAMVPRMKSMSWPPTWDLSRNLIRLLDEIGLRRIGSSYDAASTNKMAENYQRVPLAASAPDDADAYDGSTALPDAAQGAIDAALVTATAPVAATAEFAAARNAADARVMQDVVPLISFPHANDVVPEGVAGALVLSPYAARNSLTGLLAKMALGIFGESTAGNVREKKERLAKILESRSRNPPWLEDTSELLMRRRLKWFGFVMAHRRPNSLRRDGPDQMATPCSIHDLKAIHTQVLNSTQDAPLLFGETGVAGQAHLERLLAVKVALINEGHPDFAPKLGMSVALTSTWAKMDLRRVVGACDVASTTLMRACMVGNISGLPIPGFTARTEAFGKLAEFYEWLNDIFVLFAFSRQVVCSRQDSKYVTACAAYGKLMTWYVTANPDLAARPEGAIAREPIESLVALMAFFEVQLEMLEVLNASRTDDVLFGLVPGRFNSSRIEHEFGGFRMANGHSALSGVSAERFAKRRAAKLAHDADIEGFDVGGGVRPDLIVLPTT